MMEKKIDIEGKKVFLRLKSGKIINGIILSYENDLIKIRDKFGMIVFVFEKEIELMEEKR